MFIKGLIIFIDDYSQDEKVEITRCLDKICKLNEMDNKNSLLIRNSIDFFDFKAIEFRERQVKNRNDQSNQDNTDTKNIIQNVVFLLDQKSKNAFLDDINAGRYRSKWLLFNRIHKNFTPGYLCLDLPRDCNYSKNSTASNKMYLDFKLNSEHLSLIEQDLFSYDINLSSNDLINLIQNKFTQFTSIFRKYTTASFTYEDICESLLRAYNFKIAKKSFFTPYMQLRYCLVDLPKRKILRKQYRDKVLKPLVFSYYTTSTVSKDEYKNKLLEFKNNVLFPTSKKEMSCIQEIIDFVDEPEADELRELVLNAKDATFSESDLKNSRLLFFDVNHLINFKNSISTPNG